MALERQNIEKKDFPIGRRGYDPQAVDDHLQTLADQIEELKRSSRRRSETLASSASEQVRAIVEAAETSAAEIQRQAEEEARDIRRDAANEARAAREEAMEQAREYIGRVSESTTGMLQRVDAMENELGALVESLRTGGNRLTADLQLLEGNLREVGSSISTGSRFEPEEPEPALTQAPSGGDQATIVTPAEPEPQEQPQVGEPPAEAHEEPSLPAAPPADTDDDNEGARLIALNMALNGTPREETERYLAENFQLSDRHGILDEVYSSIEG